MTQSLHMSRLLSLWLVDLVEAMRRGLDSRSSGRQRFNALWIPVAIIIAGAVAMTIYCTVRGYSGWEWKWTWRGLKARCV